MKKSYLQHLQKGDHPTSLPKSPIRGRRLLLGDTDQGVQTYNLKARLNGAAVDTRMVMAAAKGIVTKITRHQLTSCGGHISITKTWATSRGKGTKMSNMYQKTLTSYETTVSPRPMKVPMKIQFLRHDTQLGPDWLSTDTRYNWTMEKEGSKQVTIAGSNAKWQITLLLTATKAGTLLPPSTVEKIPNVYQRLHFHQTGIQLLPTTTGAMKNICCATLTTLFYLTSADEERNYNFQTKKPLL